MIENDKYFKADNQIQVIHVENYMPYTLYSFNAYYEILIRRMNNLHNMSSRFSYDSFFKKTFKTNMQKDIVNKLSYNITLNEYQTYIFNKNIKTVNKHLFKFSKIK